MANFRHPLLLRLAEKAPHCMACGARNEGQVVSAHSNQARDGKAMAMKASDAAIAFVCALPCHYRIDQGNEPKAVKFELWEQAHRATMRWLLESGHLIPSAVPTPPPVIEAKPKAKIPARKSPWPQGRKLESAAAIPARKDPWPKGRKLQSRPFNAKSAAPAGSDA